MNAELSRCLARIDHAGAAEMLEHLVKHFGLAVTLGLMASNEMRIAGLIEKNNSNCTAQLLFTLEKLRSRALVLAQSAQRVREIERQR